MKILPLTDFVERFGELESVFLEIDGSMERYAVSKMAFHRNMPLMNLEGIDTVDEAEELVGTEVYIERSQRGSLPDDSFYFDEIEGFRVVSAAGETIGILKDVYHLPASDCLVVEREGEERLIPFVKELVSGVDIEAGIITVVDMPSLWEE